ncbi:YPDG domain-containing protein [Corynebacterium sp. CCM 8835]|uniref:YPDG domain-containing protein n=1 Tax=Corynebacterium antarcticum TaxID=2800405 RepID=A0ABS1FNN0_9CORY|nr:Rib/alpha-like domain-containing protein [Corynebacterium antarcticum]MCK7641950.1 YPDG domain-containing protein [Corynebacterium antarcticum]MCK7659947.1 YPDG domain-containing protein [Corynebacterium antarcticum]MCL0245174.1 YPDG domain-containing protein [Corynebacterium antarcticum]MCX7539272.1 Rib/alpha-like domain-containing protein [Corynebacterium antarcticum]
MNTFPDSRRRSLCAAGLALTLLSPITTSVAVAEEGADDALTNRYDPLFGEARATVGADTTSTAPTFDDTTTDQLDDAPAPENTTFTLGEGAPQSARIDATTGAVTYTATHDDAGKVISVPVTVTYSDTSTDEGAVYFVVADPHGGTAKKYTVNYTTTHSHAGEKAVSEAPTFDDTTTEAVETLPAPEGARFKLSRKARNAEIDAATGVVTFTAPESDANTTVNIPVVVFYPDESHAHADAPFEVFHHDHGHDGEEPEPGNPAPNPFGSSGGSGTAILGAGALVAFVAGIMHFFRTHPLTIPGLSLPW